MTRMKAWQMTKCPLTGELRITEVAVVVKTVLESHILFYFIFGEFTTHFGTTIFSGWIESDVRCRYDFDFDPWPSGSQPLSPTSARVTIGCSTWKASSCQTRAISSCGNWKPHSVSARIGKPKVQTFYPPVF